MVKTSNEEKIEALISATTDPVQRATLMVLSKIDVALDANTAATERIAKGVETVDEQLGRHVADEEKMLASIRGGQWVGGALMTVIVGLGGFILIPHMTINTTQEREIVELRTNQQNVLRRLLAIEEHVKESRK